MRTPLTTKLYQLQHRAKQLAWLFLTHEIEVEFRVIYCAGDEFPWRVFETHRRVEGGQAVLRRMHCFRSEAKLLQSLEEYAAWKRQDRALVTGYWLNNLSDGLEKERRELRKRMYVTQADRVVDLLRPRPHPSRLL